MYLFKATCHYPFLSILPFESETLSVTSVAVNIFVRPVASYPGVQKSRADPAFEASFVPDPVLGEDLVSVVDVASTTRASLSVWGLDHVVFVFDVTVAVPEIPKEKPEVKGGKVYRKKLLKRFKSSRFATDVTCIIPFSSKQTPTEQCRRGG